MGYEQMERRGPLRFLAAAVSGQSHQWRQGLGKRSAAHEQSCKYCLEDGSQHVTGKQHLSGSAVSPIQNQARRPSCDHSHGGQAGAIGLPYALLRDEIRRPGSKIVRGPTPRETDRTTQMEKPPSWDFALLKLQPKTPDFLRIGVGVSGETYRYQSICSCGARVELRTHREARFEMFHEHPHAGRGTAARGSHCGDSNRSLVFG